MAPGSLLGLLLVSWSLTNGVVSQKTLQVSPGQNVTLPCTTTEKIQDIRKVTVEWKKKDSFVLIFRSGKPYPDEQDPQFTGRAEMADPELKNGNLSLILKKTQLSDSGDYQCWFGDKSKSNTRDPKLITNVTLEVTAEETSSGHEAGEDEINVGLGRGRLVIYVLVAAVAVFVVVVSAAGVFLYKMRKQEPEVDQNVDPEQAAPLS